MLTANERQELQKEAKVLERFIRMELVNEFGKSVEEAKEIISKANIFESLVEDEQGLHESPHQWALILLTKNKDAQALELYYKNQQH